MDELMLKIDNVSKQYKLGQIGGTTLRDELQRLGAKMRGKEDPTKRIGAKDYNKGEIFTALDCVSFEVKKGERVGIIGHNGAGKSTLLKLISRVTAPTGGTIGLNGRVASMLEVGTGFHPELTGRENIYMNGAILGMTKKEIDSKMEDIIEFSEVRQFIDTPVKRYSSGMYVKLAFSVAAHLDSEIVIMDEVLAVGDMAFQKKCLEKMKNISCEYGRTILYVSHNMNTIRQLCDRVIVLNHGKIIYNGDVEGGIAVYSNSGVEENELCVNLDIAPRDRNNEKFYRVRMLKSEFVDRDNCIFERGEHIKIKVKWYSKVEIYGVRARMLVHTQNGGYLIGTSMSDPIGDSRQGMYYETILSLDTTSLSKGVYFIGLSMFQSDGAGGLTTVDLVYRVCRIEITEHIKLTDTVNGWRSDTFGYVHFPKLGIVNTYEFKHDVE